MFASGSSRPTNVWNKVLLAMVVFGLRFSASLSGPSIARRVPRRALVFAIDLQPAYLE
jgi:hypothetical protein